MTKFAKALFALVLVAAGGLSSASFAGYKYDQPFDVPADPYSRNVDFVNLSKNPIWRVQISNVDMNEWTDLDLLGDQTIDGHGDAVLSPADDQGYCRFDTLITYKDGTQVRVMDVNFCDTHTIKVNENGDSWVA